MPPDPEGRATFVEALVGDYCRAFEIEDRRIVRAIVNRSGIIEIPDEETVTTLDGRPQKYMLEDPYLEDFLRFFPPETVLTALQEGIPRGFLPRSEAKRAFCEYINDPRIPFYTLDELADLIERFRAYQEGQGQVLLELGYPDAHFDESQYLALTLGNLLPTTPPSGYEEVGPAGQTLLEGLSRQDKDTIRGVRPMLLEARASVLSILAGAVRRRDPSRLWENCATAVRERLKPVDLDFLRAVEQSYDAAAALAGSQESGPVGEHGRSNRLCRRNPLLRPGGLSDLLGVMTHCEEEIRNGQLDWTRRRLLTFPFRVMPLTYRNFLLPPWDEEFDTAVEEFFRRQRRTERFVRENDERVEAFFRGSLATERSSCKPAETAGHLSFRLPRVLRRSPKHFESIESEVASPEDTSDSSIVTQEEATCSEGNRLTRDGRVWLVTFKRITKPLIDSKGVRYIAYLLSLRGQEIDVLALSLAAHPQPIERQGKTYSGMSAEQLAEEGLHIGDLGDAGPQLEPETANYYRSRLRDNQSELDEAEANHDLGRVASLKEERQGIRRELRSKLGLGGRIRKDSDTEQRARKAVTMAIKYSLQSIREVHEPLYLHLANSIKTGKNCFYLPEEPTHWSVQF